LDVYLPEPTDSSLNRWPLPERGWLGLRERMCKLLRLRGLGLSRRDVHLLLLTYYLGVMEERPVPAVLPELRRQAAVGVAGVQRHLVYSPLQVWELPKLLR
jgi:hypothetical protein